MTISLHEPQFDAADIEIVVETLRSSWVSTGGPHVDEFERAFAAYVGMRFAVSVSSGTVGLQLLLETLKRQRAVHGAFEVLVPTLTFIATANAVIHAGGRPVFVDCERERLNVGSMQFESFLALHYVRSGEHWISKQSGLPLLALMPAHIMGWCADMNSIREFCRRVELPLLEDAAEALGCFDLEGKHLGHHGLAACFSFNGNKILTTGGGGMVVTNDEAFARRAKHLSTTAKTDGLRFVHDEVGYNFRLVNLLAALGCSQLDKLPHRLERKTRIAALYGQVLETVRGVRIHRESHCRSNHWLVNLVFDEPAHREAALSALLGADIQARPLWTPNHLQPAYREFDQPTREYPHATWMWERCLSVPSSPQLPDEVIWRICEIIGAAVGSGTKSAAGDPKLQRG